MVQISKARKDYRKDGYSRRCIYYKKKKSKTAATTPITDNFLNSQFSPIAPGLPVKNVIARRQREYFRSLKYLSMYYKFQPDDKVCLPYPLDIYYSLKNVQQKLKLVDQKLLPVIIEKEDTSICLATVEVFDTGHTLFYIPVQPVFSLLNRREKRMEAELMLSIMSWLHKKAGVPFFSGGNDFVDGTYEMVENWIVDEPGEWGKEEFDAIHNEIKWLKYGGNKMRRIISSPIHLECFHERIERYKNSAVLSDDLLNLSMAVFNLMNLFPERNIADTFVPQIIAPKEEQRIYPGQYLSFIWKDHGPLWDQFIESVNVSLQEYGVIEEPLALKLFQKAEPVKSHDLSFENNLFRLIDELVSLLNKIS